MASKLQTSINRIEKTVPRVNVAQRDTTIIKVLHTFYARCRRVSINTPLDWKTDHLVSIFEKRKRKYPGYCRDLNMNSFISRLLSKVMHNQIRKDIGKISSK